MRVYMGKDYTLQYQLAETPKGYDRSWAKLYNLEGQEVGAWQKRYGYWRGTFGHFRLISDLVSHLDTISVSELD